MFQPRRFGPGAGLASTDLSDADLSGFDPRGDSLPDGDLAGASLPYADLAHAVRTGLGPLPGQGTDLDWANLEPARLAGAICGSPNCLSALSANLAAVGVPASGSPPL